MLTRQTCFSQQRIISVFVNAHQSTQEDYTADMGQTVTALKLKKKINGVSKQNLVGAAVLTYEHNPPRPIQKQTRTNHTWEERLLDPLSFAVCPPSQKHSAAYRESPVWSKPFLALH